MYVSNISAFKGIFTKAYCKNSYVSQRNEDF